LTNQSVYQILVYPERPFVKFAHRRSFASSRRAFFIFSRAVFRAAPQLTELLEEARPTVAQSQRSCWMLNLWLPPDFRLFGFLEDENGQEVFLRFRERTRSRTVRVHKRNITPQFDLNVKIGGELYLRAVRG